MKIVKKSIEVSGRTLSLEVGRFAEQASAAVLAQYGDTTVLSTVTASARETTLDYFPLSVEYVERLYAGGRIKGSRWVKREGRPSDDAVLAGRVIDRSIRPLFPKAYKHDVQVILTVLSVDGENQVTFFHTRCLRRVTRGNLRYHRRSKRGRRGKNRKWIHKKEDDYAQKEIEKRSSDNNR